MKIVSTLLILVPTTFFIVVALILAIKQYIENRGNKEHYLRGGKILASLVIALVILETGIHSGLLPLNPDPLSGRIHLPIAKFTFYWFLFVGITGGVSAGLEKIGWRSGIICRFISTVHAAITAYHLPLYALLLSIVTGGIFLLRSYPFFG